MDRVINNLLLDSLTLQAKLSERLRQNYNLHKSFEEPSQRLLNAIEPYSYIRPHRHLVEKRDEYLSVLRGKFLFVTFNDEGVVMSVLRLGLSSDCDALAVEIAPTTWHTVIALVSGSVLFEAKPGPFNPNKSKDLAPWAPEENTDDVTKYIENLLRHMERH